MEEKEGDLGGERPVNFIPLILSREDHDEKKPQDFVRFGLSLFSEC